MGKKDKIKISKESVFRGISTTVEILGLILVYLTLREMQIERTNTYLPNIVFEPVSYMVMWNQDGVSSDEVDRISSFMQDSIQFSERESHWSNTVFTPGMDYGSACSRKYKLALPMLNIGVGTASEVSIELKHDDILNAINDFNANDTVDGYQCDLDLKVEDYFCEKEYTDIVTDIIEYSDESTSYNMIHASTSIINYPYLLSQNGNTQQFYLPDIYYSFIYGSILRYKEYFTIYGTYKIPDIPITITYRDAQGRRYEHLYKIHTQSSTDNADIISTISIERA